MWTPMRSLSILSVLMPSSRDSLWYHWNSCRGIRMGGREVQKVSEMGHNVDWLSYWSPRSLQAQWPPKDQPFSSYRGPLQEKFFRKELDEDEQAFSRWLSLLPSNLVYPFRTWIAYAFRLPERIRRQAYLHFQTLIWLPGERNIFTLMCSINRRKGWHRSNLHQ